MSKGRRYEKEPKLNMKKVLAVLIAIVVFVMFIFIIKGILSKGEDKGKITSTSYFSVFKDNKWGVIDSDGNIVIDPSYEEMIIIPDNKKDVFICTYNVNYETGEYKTKALNSENKEILTGYDQIEIITNTDEAGNLWYANNMLKVKKDGKIGLIDLEGKVKIEPKYSDITNLGQNDKSGFIVKNDQGKFGIIDYSDAQILEAKFDAVEKIYGNDMYVVKEANKQKLVGKDGNVILQDKFDEIKSILKSKENGIIFVSGGKYGVMKTTGDATIPATYESLTEAKDGILIAKKDGKYGLIDITNTEKIQFKYAGINYNEVADIYILEDENSNATILNGNLETKLSGMVIKIDDEKGYMKVRVGDEYKYYNFKFEEKQASEVLTSNTLFLSKKDGKYGFIDKDANVVVDHIYDDAQEQNSCGYAAIKKDGKWGCIDNKGNVVLEPTYNLDNYLLIDFIGRWHLGQDINLNYYKQ